MTVPACGGWPGWRRGSCTWRRPSRRGGWTGARVIWPPFYLSTRGWYMSAPAASMAIAAVRRWLKRGQWRRKMRARSAASLAILRVPGIYADDRLPLKRLREGTPALAPQDDVYTNHIHADDLARIIERALWRARPGRLYHASDD